MRSRPSSLEKTFSVVFLFLWWLISGMFRKEELTEIERNTFFVVKLSTSVQIFLEKERKHV